jgi:serine/threonine protein kinase
MRLIARPGTGLGVASQREWGLIGLSLPVSLWTCLWAIAKDDGWTGAGLVPGSEAGVGARLVAGRYQLTAELGRGGMGVVWLAEDQLVGRQVAVKELRALPGMSQAEQQTYRQRALQEARSAARIDHPGAVTLYDVLPASDRDDAVYLIMELVQGPTLAQVIGQHGRLAEATVAAFGLQLLDVLDAAHALGVVHRDIKPANILVTPGGQAKLTDFGIAHTIGDLRLTRSGVMGTQAYMAPELFESAPITPAADVWSLGATLYAAAEGCGPFERDTTGATLRAILIDDPPAPRCSPALAAALAGMLQRDPARRASTGQARAALHTAAQTAPPPGSDGAPPASHRQPHPSWAQLPTTRAPAPPPAPQRPRHTAQPPPPGQPGPSRRTPILVGAVAALAAITTGILATSHHNTPQPKPLPRSATSTHGGTPQPSAPALNSLVATLADPQGALNSEGVSSLAFSPDGKTLATGDGNNHVYLWNTATHTVALTMTDSNTGSTMSALAFSPNGQTLAIGDDSGGVYLQPVAADEKSGNGLNDGNGGNEVSSLAFSPNGQTLAGTLENDNTVYLWSVATQKITARLTDPNSLNANYGVFSPNGQTLAVADDNGGTYLWDTATRSVTATLADPGGGGVTWASFSANGQTLATGDTKGVIYLWNMTTRSLSATLTGPSGPSSNGVAWVALSPDGQTLAAAYNSSGSSINAFGSTVYLWNTATGKLTATLTDPGSQGAQAGAFSPYGQTLAIADNNGSTYLWQVPAGG